jgi:hypothetical protein
MLEIVSLSIGIVLFMLGIMMLIWTKNFIIMRFEGFHKAIRKKEIDIKYRRLAVYNAILYFIMAIPLLSIAIIGFVNEMEYLTYVWVFVPVAVLGLIGILYSNISKKFIQPIEQTTEPVQ